MHREQHRTPPLTHIGSSSRPYNEVSKCSNQIVINFIIFIISVFTIFPNDHGTYYMIPILNCSISLMHDYLHLQAKAKIYYS